MSRLHRLQRSVTQPLSTGATICFLISFYLGRGIIELYKLDSVLAGYRDKVGDGQPLT